MTFCIWKSSSKQQSHHGSYILHSAFAQIQHPHMKKKWLLYGSNGWSVAVMPLYNIYKMHEGAIWWCVDCIFGKHVRLSFIVRVEHNCSMAAGCSAEYSNSYMREQIENRFRITANSENGKSVWHFIINTAQRGFILCECVKWIVHVFRMQEAVWESFLS